MELLQLRYFYECAREENFTKVAGKYMVPASSVSASVKRLEKELGCALFDRSCNHVVLNENGKRLQQSLHVVFKELDQAVESLRTERVEDREINVRVFALRGHITDRVIAYQARHPQIRFRTVFGTGGFDLIDYDIIVDEASEKYADYEKFEIYSERLYIHASVDSPLCGRRLRMYQLRNQAFVSMGEKSHLCEILMRACEQAGFEPNIVVHSNDNACYAKCIAAGIGIGIGRMKQPEKKLLTTLDVVDFDERQTVYVYYKKQATCGNVERFLEFLKTAVI